MQIPRRKTRLADKVAIAFASLLLAVDMMVRYPKPAVAATPHVQSDLTMCLVVMVPGLCIVAYCLFLERHTLWAHAEPPN